MADDAAAAGARPPVSVVVPFAGDEAEAEDLLEAFAVLELRPGDELIVVDNNREAVVGGLRPPLRALHAGEQRSSYYARNRGAEAALNEWLLFADADCLPEPALLDRYFSPPPAPEVGALAGPVEALPGSSLAERWAAVRAVLDQQTVAQLPEGAAAVTANLLVRRAAWRSLGGFLEGVRSGADLEFCWRLGDAGWALEQRPAAVEHRNRRSLAALVRQMRRYGAGNAWQDRRRPGASPAPQPLGALVRMAGAASLRALRGRFDEAALGGVDALALAANTLGRVEGNAAPLRLPAPGTDSLALVTDSFPAISETFVATEARALAALGWRVRIEAAARPQRPLLGGAREWRVDYLEDAGAAGRAAALAWVLVRHPLRAAADLLGRRRWPPSERMPLRGVAPLARRVQRAGDRHLHVHFAGPAATHALRAGRLAGIPVSVAVHGHDVYAAPSGLPQKLVAASFVAVPCEYVGREIKAMPGGPRKTRRIVMGVDGERFRRRAPAPGGRTVVAIGRYVEKKGFAHLLEAAALLDRGEGAIEVVIGGDGPLREPLELRVRELRLQGSVSMPRADDAEAVRDLLERADLLAMPCVIAADGDRDSMPVVVKEALSMELPVVASNAVGLPEMVKPAWGRLVTPGDPGDLAAAISELLALPASERAAMGRRGRAFVLEHCDPTHEAQLLLEAVRASASGGGRRSWRR